MGGAGMSAVRDWGVFTLHLGDCLDVMRAMPDASVDSIVTDPPYGIRFMGKAWDGADIEARHAARVAMPSHAPNAGPNGGHKSVAAEAGKYDLGPAAALAFQEFSAAWAREALRVLKPGGHAVVFASTRTYHRMTCGVEDAGFEIRDQIGWTFGSGFPKSHNGPWGGTALKPAWEPIMLARKPLIGTVAANVLAHGTGGLNIDGCRVPTIDDLNGGAYSGERQESAGTWAGCGTLHKATGKDFAQPLGRWPANLIHDGSEEVLAAFPQAVGQIADASSSEGRKTQNVYGAMRRGRGDEPSADSENEGAVGFKMKPGARRGDAGSAARFFYVAKASRSDRNEGLHGMPSGNNMRVNAPRASEGEKHASVGANTHPTVKPTDLMRYLCRLITPPGGIVLDPFVGSGSTGKAAMKEGFRFVGIDLSAEYLDIAERRIAHAAFGPLAFGVAA